MWAEPVPTIAMAGVRARAAVARRKLAEGAVRSRFPFRAGAAEFKPGHSAREKKSNDTK